MIKAAFFDIDGTLVSFDTHRIPASAVETLKRLRAAGVKTFLSTGRNGDSTRFLRETGLFDGEVLINGQYCTIGDECVYTYPVSESDLNAALAGIESGEFTLGFLGGHQSFVSNVNDYVVRACEYAGMVIPPVAPADEARRHAICQIHFYGPPGSEDALIARTNDLVAVRWSPNFADVYPKNGGKDRGIAAVCQRLGITADEIIAFGDGENDISMLKYAGIGVAMGNASDKVKSAADYITATVDEDGVARAVEHFAHLMRLN